MIQRARGTRDLLPPETRVWQAVEAVARDVFNAFGGEEIRTPIFEPTELFVRSVGESTDIVHKEMYTFEDRKARSLTLRPEGTAGVARAWLENRMADRSHPLRLYYIGPMFRYERMQHGRYRQFSQIGLEIIGSHSPLADAELLVTLHELFTRLGFADLVFHLNNLGDPEDRPRFQAALRELLGSRAAELCGDCQRRLEENALRVLDCKVASCQAIVAELPTIEAFASDASREHVAAVEAQLQRLEVPYVRNPRLVRGLDYYLRTVFEVVSPQLGNNAVLCGGGRYDRLISDLGGPDVPGVGFAVGEDRLVEVLPQATREGCLKRPAIYLVGLGDVARSEVLRLARDWVRAGIAVELETTGRSLKAALKRADKDGLEVVAILGDNELATGSIAMRDLSRSVQEVIPIVDLPRWWRERQGQA